MKIGNVISLWRYPVKSLLGEKIDRLEIDLRGVRHDRIYAISNSDGKFGSGKNTNRFRRIDNLFSMSSKLTNNGVSIKFPDGIELNNTNQNLHSKLSQTLKQEVTLTKENDISHFDDGAVHIITTGSLAILERLLPNCDIDSHRFRPNILLDSQLVDHELIGHKVKIGSTILEITHKTQRCRMITLAQRDLTNQPKILKTISKDFALDFGVYAQVISTGTISNNDSVEIIDKS